ncbi:cysteine sulfinic acid decarboxylase isoform X2 [Orcinus orca]|uniref:cysteine sulfinic acid decarboxylase isoform X2 n=1 Tax=Orcinus orca TaxID=9733 RepID=UPI00122FACBD|nr:cysteine sulfinic acid decarboxylase isoform X2 [Globicephala melas]XP_033292081.1 cysteine sulfinic acid decarboxylase isoform X2 [Orcinus orca]
MADSQPLLSLDGDAVAAEALLRDVFGIVVDEVIRKGTSASEKVCEWREPEELKQLLDLELRNEGESQEQILERCRAVIRYSVKTCHPRFFNQLFSGLDPHALAGRIVTESLNTSQYTYEIAPVFVLMEEEVLKKLRALVGWSSGDGVFCPGGSISNMYAVNLARYQRYPDCKQRGLWALPPLALFTSEECHYSVKKGAAFLGLGTDSVRMVKADERGKMIPEDLERQIGLAEAEGAVPFLVSVTSGTTVLGAFDPLEAVADVCQRHGLWLHVDAAWGGSVLLSQTHRHLLNGIQRTCSSAATGPRPATCSSRTSSTMWLWTLETRYLVEELKKRETFELVMEPEFVNVCFWFVPPSLREKKGSPDYGERLATVAPILKERMVRKGSMMIGYQPHGTRGNFFRMVVANPALTRADMDFLLNELERLGQDL